MIFTIYMHKNKINGKVYIGQTIQEPKKRWKNGKAYKSCFAFNSAIEKYGWDNFDHIILEQGEMTYDIANQKEQYYIDKYNSLNPNFGYNIVAGGSNGISPNAEPAAIQWMKDHPEFGMARAEDMLKWQKENPEKALELRRANQKKMVEARKRPVRCIETGAVYESAAEAARCVEKTTQSKICMVCRGQRKTCGGYHWEYVKQEK